MTRGSDTDESNNVAVGVMGHSKSVDELIEYGVVGRRRNVVEIDERGHWRLVGRVA